MVWKFQDFSVTQILREINFGKSKSSKTDIFATLGVLNFVSFVKFRLAKVQKFKKKLKFRASQCVRMADFDFTKNLSVRKILQIPHYGVLTLNFVPKEIGTLTVDDTDSKRQNWQHCLSQMSKLLRSNFTSRKMMHVCKIGKDMCFL